MKTSRYVRPQGNGWMIVKDGQRRGTEHASTKREAVSRARSLLRREGGGELRVMNSFGKMTDADTVPPLRPRSTGS